MLVRDTECWLDKENFVAISFFYTVDFLNTKQKKAFNTVVIKTSAAIFQNIHFGGVIG